MSKYRLYIGVLIGLTIGILGSYTYSTYLQIPPLGAAALREESTNYRFIDPLLACNSGEATTGRYKELDDSLRKVVVADIKSSKASNVSIYFQEYPSGRWVGIDENHQYDPASLLKIVLMISYFKDEELHPGSLQKSYVFTPELQQMNNNIPFDSTTSLTVGKEYSAEELIRAMIIDSDNGAKDVLLDRANSATLDQVYKDLKIPAPEDSGPPYTISPRQYSLFFRILYNSTYLSRQLSEKAMSILAQAEYSNGLVAGLPKNVTVAHKFGEHVNGNPQKGIDSVELHDCGVVYGPNLPYFLCVMTTGKTIDGLESTIKDISQEVYDALDTNTSSKMAQ